MAETSVEIYRRKLRELEDKRLRNEIGDVEYFSELDVLRKRLQEEQTSETELKYTPGEKEREYYFDVLGKLEGQGAANLYGERFEKMGMDPSEAFAKGKEKIAADTKKIRYGTGEFIEPLPSTFAVSDIVDPVKGLIKDPATGEVRKATTGEMVSSALFERQRKPTKLTTEEARYQFERDTEKFRKDLTTKAKLKKIGAGRGVQNLNLITLSPEEEEEIEQAVKERGPLTRLDVSRQPDSPAVIMETPLDYGLRLINTLSAVAEPAVKILQEGYRARQNARLYFRTGNPETMPKAKTRKGAGFKETEIEGTGGQILTNLLTGQGVFDRTQAQMLPPDEKTSGIDYFMTQGTLPTMAMSLATELPIPITPLGIPGVGKAIKYPFRAFQSAAARAEIDLALRSAETKLTAKDLQTQIKVQGGTADTPTLRKKAAEVIGDQYGTHENARHLIMTKGSRERVVRNDFANPSTPYVEEIFKGASEVEIEDVKKVFDKMEEVFSGAVVGGKNEKIILRRVKQVAADTRDHIFTGKKPFRDKGIIKRAINRSKMEDRDVWNKAREEGIPEEFSKTFDETYDILELQKHQQLTPDELIKLGKNFKILDEAGLLPFRKSFIEGKHIYAAVRNAVSDVMRDNFLKNVPDDMIYVGQNVAVSYKKATNKSLMDKFTKQVQPYFEETQEGILESFAAQKILRLQSRKGFELPSSLQEKVSQLANGVEVKLHPIESQYLTNVIKEEFALDLLDGVRIKTGTLTGQLAEVPRGALRQTLIKSGKAPTTSVIWGKSIANSIRLLLTKGGDYSQATGGRISKWFKVLSDDVPAPMRQLSTSISRAHGAATDKVGAALQPPPGVRPEQHFQDTFNRYEQEAMDINLQRIEGNIRAGEELAIDSTARSEFVGTVDYEAIYQPSMDKLQESRAKIAQERLGQESAKILDNFEQKVATAEKTLANTYAKDLERIKKKYEKKDVRLGLKTQEFVGRLTSKELRDKRRLQYIKGFEQQAAKKEVLINIRQYEEARKLLQEAIEAEQSAIYDQVGKIVDSPKFKKLQETTDKKLETLQTRINKKITKNLEEQTQKSEKVATTRKLVQLSDTYGRDNVKDFLAQELGISPKEVQYEDLIEQVDFIQENMQEASRQIYMAKTWKNMIKDFFVSPKDVEALDPRWVDNIDDLIRIDKSQPYWVAGNIKPLTIDTYKEVIGQLRELDQSLKNYGLQTAYGKKEVYVLPFINKMIQTQRAMDMKVEIDNFITKSPDMFVNLDRAVDGTLGLRSTEQLAKQITSEIKNTFSFAKSKGLADDEMIDLFTHQIREALFDGWAADIWKNSSRKVQTSFIEKYMTKVIQDGTPIINDMDGFVIDLYNSNILKSNTFESIEKKSREVLNKISSKFAEEGMTKEQGKVFEMLEKTLLSEEGLILDMRKQYLNNLTLRSDGVMDGLFTQQIESINDYFGRYGLNNETMLENVKRMEPRLKYMGARNIGVIYGDMHQKMMNEVVEIANNTKGKRFISELQTRFATAKNPQSNFAEYYFADAVNVTRRWSIARMLGGVLEPSTKFFGMNRMTAPYLFFAALGSGSMKASTAAKFTALATGGGLVPLPIVTAAVRQLGNKSFTGFIDSNKVMLAPAEEVLIRQSDGAVRNMTAGELREIMLNEGVMYSRADADFLDTQFNRLLIDAGITVDGLARYYNHPKSLARKIYDNLSPSGKNLWAEFAKFQDTEMRRYVFMQALKDGESIPNAAEKARRSMLDYGSLSDIEKNRYFRQIYFYSFMRTMGAETINAIYRGVLGDNFNPAIGLIKAQSRLNKETEDRAMSMQTDSRIYNLFKGDAEGQSSYMGGPVNPSVSMFDLMSRATLMMTAGIQSMTREQQDFEMSLLDSVSAALSATGTSAGETYISGNPFLSILMEGYRASKEERPIPFPSELQYEAEKNGNMLEVIEQYGLEPRQRTAGRPLTTSPIRDKTTGEILYPAGTYFDFPRTSKGLYEGYNLYLWQRVVGLTALAEVASRSGIAPAAMTRFHKDTLRASMASARDPRMEGREGEVRIPMESVYIKTLNQQDLDMRSNIVYALYMLGLATPVKATKRNVIMERLLRNAQEQIKQTEDKLNEQR